jgi:hypothetical protein
MNVKYLFFLLLLTLIISCSKEIETEIITETEITPILNITIEGEGTVTESYEHETVVKLTSVPSEGWEFVAWSGDLTGDENPVNVTLTDSINITAKFMRYFNYNIPSHEWKNNIQPWLDLNKATSDNGLFEEPFEGPSTTGTAYADFNYDGYIDIMTPVSIQDGMDHDFYFLINDGNDNFILDNSIVFEKTVEAIGARKTIVGDFNGDNKPDVVRCAGGHDIVKKPNITLSTEGGFVFNEISNAPISQFHTVSSGDIDNDGDLDLFFAQSGGLDGFAINDGSANFTWKPIIEIIDNFTIDGIQGFYGIWTSEMYDVNKDGNIDLVVAGEYKDTDDDESFLDGPTIFWGNGTGLFDYNTSTSIYVSRDLDISNDNRIEVTNDIVFNDVEGDGFVEFVSSSVLESGHTYIQIFKGLEDYSFENKTQDWLTDNLLIEGTTWIFLRDVDNNGFIDIVESETFVSRNDGSYGPSIRWEWNGSSFTKIN